MCRLKSLKELNLAKCAKLKGLPHELGNLKSLKSLNASNAGIKRLPDSIGCLTQLESLTLSGCKKLKKLPPSVCNLTSVSTLHLERCSSVEKFPDEWGDWKGLSGIYASDTRIKRLPDSIGNLSDLHSLSLTNCCNLKSLPNSICKLKSLRPLRLTNCLNPQELPEKLGDIHRLEDIGVSGTRVTQLPDSIQQIPYLHTLLLNNCKQLRSVPGRNLGLSIIRVLALRDCNLTDNDIPNDIWELSTLMVLDLTGNNFSCLPSGLGQLDNLRVLYARECRLLQKLPNLSTLKSLRNIALSNCDKLVEILGLENLCCLELVSLDGCSSLLTVIDNFLLQGYGQGLCDCEFHFSRRDTPDWFEFQGTGVSSHLFDTSSDVNVGSLHLIIWVDYLFGDDGDKFIRIDVHVHNKTSGVKWNSKILGRRTMESSIIMGPVMESGDIFEVSFELQEEKYAKVEKFGIHLSSISNINSS